MENIHYNANEYKHIREYCALDEVSKQLLKTAMERNLSARDYDRILKVAHYCRPGCSSKVISSHIAEAIQYRSLDRDGWLG
jgi:magnesium chelatase family protein